MVLVGVSRDESHLRHSVIVEPVVATDSDELACALDDESHSGLAVDLSEACDFTGAQIVVWIEISQPDGAGRKVAMESQ
jgi:hypothetical protein